MGRLTLTIYNNIIIFSPQFTSLSGGCRQLKRWWERLITFLCPLVILNRSIVLVWALGILTKNTSQCWWLVYSEFDFGGWGPSPGMQIITKVRAARSRVTLKWIFKSNLTWSTLLICNHQNSCCSSCFKAFYQWILLLSSMTKLFII